MGSLASSPLVPFVTAGLAGALIIGTSYGGNSEDANAADDAADAVAAEEATATAAQVEKDFAAEQAAGTSATGPVDTAAGTGGAAAAAPTTPTTTCTATACTVVFPVAGGNATVFKKPFVMTKGFASRGGAFTLGGKKVSASKAKPATAPGGFTVTISEATPTSITAVVTKK